MRAMIIKRSKHVLVPSSDFCVDLITNMKCYLWPKRRWHPVGCDSKCAAQGLIGHDCHHHHHHQQQHHWVSSLSLATHRADVIRPRLNGLASSSGRSHREGPVVWWQHDHVQLIISPSPIPRCSLIIFHHLIIFNCPFAIGQLYIHK